MKKQTVVMNKKDYLMEHAKLIKMLTAVGKEGVAQKKEIQKYLKGVKK